MSKCSYMQLTKNSEIPQAVVEPSTLLPWVLVLSSHLGWDKAMAWYRGSSWTWGKQLLS